MSGLWKQKREDIDIGGIGDNVKLSSRAML